MKERIIYTTYLAKEKALPSDIIRFSIARWMPPGVNIPKIPMLVPSKELVKDRKEGRIDVHEFINRYEREVLRKTTIEDVLRYIEMIAGDNDVALICFEKSEQAKDYDAEEDFCHRYLVSDWLQEQGIRSEEYKF